MKKFKLTCLAIALCGFLSVSPAGAEGDGGSFDGGDFGGDYGSDFDGDFGGDYYGDDYDSGNYFDPGREFGSDFDSNDGFYQDDGFNESDDFGVENDSGQDMESVQGDGFTQESLRKELTNLPAESVESTGSVEASESTSAEIDPSTQSNDASDQIVNIQNSTYTDQNIGPNQHGGYNNHNWGHHHHDGFDLGFGLGLGMGLGFGPFSPFAPFGGFGYYGFGVPFSSFGGYYSNFSSVGFGPYRRFEAYYPLGSYSTVIAAAPLLAAPAVVVPRVQPTYTQQQGNISRPTSQQRNNYWHYCRNPEGYYPYVKECTGEWIKVPPQPS